MRKKKYQIGGDDLKYKTFQNLPDKNIYDDGQFYPIDPLQYANAPMSPDLTIPNIVPQRQNSNNFDWNNLDYFTQGLTAVLNGVQNGKFRRNEKQQYLQSIQPNMYQNYNGAGYNNTAAYFQNGGNLITYPIQALSSIPQWIQNNGDYDVVTRQNGGDIESAIAVLGAIPRWILNNGKYSISTRQNGGRVPIYNFNPDGSQTVTVPQVKNMTVGNIIPYKDQYKLPTGKRIYGPKGSFIGIMGNKNNNYTFYPDYENTAQISNEEDIQLLNNPDALNTFLNFSTGVKSNIAPYQKYSVAQNQNGGTVSSAKAKEILRDGTAQGHPLTDKQKRYFGWIAGGKKQNGGVYEDGGETYKQGGIHIDPSHEGEFTAKAKEHGMSVQEYASHVLANKDSHDPETVKQANFAHNAADWKHKNGGVNFKNKAAYSKWLAYGHMHNKFHGKEKVSIAGHPHKVDHSKQNGGYTVGQQLELSPDKIQEMRSAGYDFEIL